jgi:hypothetical protein
VVYAKGSARKVGVLASFANAGFPGGWGHVPSGKSPRIVRRTASSCQLYRAALDGGLTHMSVVRFLGLIGSKVGERNFQGSGSGGIELRSMVVFGGRIGRGSGYSHPWPEKRVSWMRHSAVLGDGRKERRGSPFRLHYS